VKTPVFVIGTVGVMPGKMGLGEDGVFPKLFTSAVVGLTKVFVGSLISLVYVDPTPDFRGCSGVIAADPDGQFFARNDLVDGPTIPVPKLKPTGVKIEER
jgi:hypothetical protein